MRPRTSPRPTARGNPSTATRPPKRLVSPLVSRSDPFVDGADSFIPGSAPGAMFRATFRATGPRPRQGYGSEQRLPETLDLDQVPVGIANEGVVDPVRRIVGGLLDDVHPVRSEV